MVMQTIENAPIIDDRFVVRQSDVDIFDSFDDDLASLARALPSPSPITPYKNKKTKLNKKKISMARHMNSFSTLHEHSADIGEPHSRLSSSSDNSLLVHPSFPSGESRRSSLCSTTSSNSSVCSKSFGFIDGDESIVSMGDDESLSTSTRSSARSTRTRRRHSGSIKNKDSKQKHQHECPPRTKPVKKSLSFTESVTVRFIPAIDEYSKEELSQVWYCEEELLQIKQDAQDLMKQAKRKEIPHTADALRGLHMSQKKERRSSWVMALTCVLDEQKRQVTRREGGGGCAGDADTLAKLYKSFAFSATQIALQVAQNDARGAAAAY